LSAGLHPHLRPAHEPTAGDLCALVPEIGHGIAKAMALLADEPTPARTAQVLAQLNGASMFVTKLRAALAKAGAGDER
jgi:hypothetical protein